MERERLSKREGEGGRRRGGSGTGRRAAGETSSLARTDTRAAPTRTTRTARRGGGGSEVAEEELGGLARWRTAAGAGAVCGSAQGVSSGIPASAVIGVRPCVAPTAQLTVTVTITLFGHAPAHAGRPSGALVLLSLLSTFPRLPASPSNFQVPAGNQGSVCIVYLSSRISRLSASRMSHQNNKNTASDFFLHFKC